MVSRSSSAQAVRPGSAARDDHCRSEVTETVIKASSAQRYIPWGATCGLRFSVRLRCRPVAEASITGRADNCAATSRSGTSTHNPRPVFRRRRIAASVTNAAIMAATGSVIIPASNGSPSAQPAFSVTHAAASAVHVKPGRSRQVPVRPQAGIEGVPLLRGDVDDTDPAVLGAFHAGNGVLWDRVRRVVVHLRVQPRALQEGDQRLEP
ncbi:hypothetical protein GCM10023323_40130 [Streptomyces thinghirensis]|uniref:Uncharacterized protein n=1 Tax=Streptomyces thinghirensis TaxID=551547 RepID=A0ABP9T8L9_9ACTN